MQRKTTTITGVFVFIVFIVLGAALSVIVSGCSSGDKTGDSSATVTPLTPTPAQSVSALTGGLPGRPTDTPDSTTNTPQADATAFILPTAPQTPVVTSPFTFPTSVTSSSTSSTAQDCTRLFPLESVAGIDFGVTTITQLEASFGRAKVQSGRAPRFRFEEGTCVLIVTVSVDTADDAELLHYGTLQLVLDQYGEPGGVGISQGNLTLLDVGNAVLLYPDAGIIAIFDVAPDDLTPTTPVASLQFRSPYEVDQQVRRLNLRPVENWTFMPPALPR
ncbi:MAG: hypothetical protein JXA10_11235 [Anaerolineae bacterium]|nr:hypothetical protein [Anaerolineae bacterium]